MARKGILSSDITRTDRTETDGAGRAPETKSTLSPPRGAVGALQSSLTRLQEAAVQDIDTALIDDAGVQDRLGIEPEAQAQLTESLRTYGQQVPVLLRPHVGRPGRYEIVYGRRRLMALRDLGLPVKAMVRQLDDAALVMAQGQENSSRQDLSFIEKASFAAQLTQQGYARQVIAAALSVDLPMLSRLLKVGTVFDLAFLRRIGSAPGIGRDRWLTLARALDADGARSGVAALMDRPDFTGSSDERFELVLARALRTRETRRRDKDAAPRTLRDASGTALAEIRRTARGVTVTIPGRTSAAFGHWVDANAEALLGDLHDRFVRETPDRSEDDPE